MIWIAMALMASVIISGKDDKWYEVILVFLLCLFLWPVVIGSVAKEIWERTGQ